MPSELPRPVAPTLTMRAFDVPDTAAAAVRLVTLENQCTGQAAYAGQQTVSTTVLTDCKAGSDRGTIVHASELQVFGEDATLPVQPTSQGTGTGGGTAPTTTASTRVRPTVSLKVLRKLQTRRNAAPKLVIRVLSESAAPEAGRLVISLDGKKWKTVSTTTGRRKVAVARQLIRGRHTVQVRFRPTDRTAFRATRSQLERIVVTGR